MELKCMGYTHYMASEVVNVCGQFLDALLSIYFLHKFFATKKQTFKYLWMIGAVVMTALTQMADYVTGNRTVVWILLLFLLPFLYTVLCENGSVRMKLLISGLPCVILMSMENFGAAIISLINTLSPLGYRDFLILYIIRRIGMKLALLFAVKFLLNYSIYDSHYQFRRYWYLLGMIESFELAILLIFRRAEGSVRSRIVYVVLDVFCCVVPMLFYYVVYLTEANLKKLQIEISQKNYIEAQEQYMMQLTTMQDSLRKFKHDYKAHLFCIDSLVLEKNYEELHEYLKKIHDLNEQYDRFRFYTADSRINVILNQMNDQAARKGIQLTITARNVDIEKIQLYDLNMLLSNLYSNAVEAALQTKEKKVDLLIEKNRAYLQIVIQNSVVSNPLRENPDFLTSKEDKELHGFGMQIMQNVVDKYEGMIQIDGTDTYLKINVLLMDEI
ncbi:MAG: GHKL domain-containing protein [Lachnospiraceae bacterium]|nr:GHKL domain-containing protein [Lachnospiraceae bacterium]